MSAAGEPAAAAAGPRAEGRDAGRGCGAARRRGPRGLRAPLRRPRGRRPRPTAIWRCSPATAATPTGLAALAAIGDLTAIAELADAISLCAQSHAEDRPEIADAVWIGAATAIGWGESPDLVGAKQRARAGQRGRWRRLARRSR